MFKEQKLSIGFGLKILLLLQCVIALLLIATDLEARWRFQMSFEQNTPEEPVSPGDQVRRYDPLRPTPRFSDPGVQPDFQLPDDMPERLEMILEEDPDAGTILILNGAIESGDATRVDAYLQSLDEAPAAVAMNSPGGIVEEALEIGRNIRERNLNTQMLAGMGCFSSCPYVLAGGVERTVSRASAVGLHQHYYETPGYMPVFFAVENIQRSQGATMGYLIEMGIDPGVMIHGLTTPPDDIYILVESELMDSGIATDMTD